MIYKDGKVNVKEIPISQTLVTDVEKPWGDNAM